MDLGAYMQIEDYKDIMSDNDISVPRLRGVRHMKNEKPFSENEIKRQALEIGLMECEDIVRRVYFSRHYSCIEYSSRTNERVKKYFYTDKQFVSGIKWDKVHGQLRKEFKFAIKKAKKKTRLSLLTFNKYCGRDDILYIRARIGGPNWKNYCSEVAHQPWFIEKVDECWDDTYCDIYAKIKHIQPSIDGGELHDL